MKNYNFDKDDIENNVEVLSVIDPYVENIFDLTFNRLTLRFENWSIGFNLFNLLKKKNYLFNGVSINELNIELNKDFQFIRTGVELVIELDPYQRIFWGIKKRFNVG